MYPVLYENGWLVIYTHDFFTFGGLLAALALYYYELRKRNMLSFEIFWISIAAIVGGSLGARLISVLDNASAYFSNLGSMPLSYFLTHSGKGIIGGILGGYLAIVLAKRLFKYKQSTGDCYAPAIPLGMAIGRIGCFLSELPLGTPTDLPWGISVSPEAASQFAICPGCSGKMHPSMVYEIIFHLAAFAIILRYRNLVKVQGDTLKLYLLGAAIFRFLVEYVRGSREYALGFTSAQVALLILTVPLVIHFVRQWRRGVYSMPLPPAVNRAPAPARPLPVTRLVTDEEGVA